MKELENYISDPNNDKNNFYLGLYYENQQHYSPAASFYLRCAEKTADLSLRYESLLRLYLCYSALGNRNHTIETLLKLAISLCPQKPEAYFFLTQYYESKSEWLNVYLYASIALDISKNKSKLLSKIDYPDSYVLIFQKAAAAWWIGKAQESRKLFRVLLNEHIDSLNDKYKTLLETNLSKLGSGPESQAVRRYNSSLKNRLNCIYQNIDLVDVNYSQVYQDMFILTVLNGKKNGTYLEIGSAHAFHNSNTALLETKFGWTGVGIEFNLDLVNTYTSQRKNPVLCTDALLINYEKLLSKYFANTNTIDYLQLDIEPPRNTYEVLLSIPFDKYKFAVITYEHDYYVDITRSYREKSRDYLEYKGYQLVVPNVSPDEHSPFEDWWVHPDLVDKHIIKSIVQYTLPGINTVEKLFLNN